MIGFESGFVLPRLQVHVHGLLRVPVVYQFCSIREMGISEYRNGPLCDLSFGRLAGMADTLSDPATLAQQAVLGRRVWFR